MVNLPVISRRRLSNITSVGHGYISGTHSDDEEEPFVPDSKEEEETIALMKRPPKAPSIRTRTLARAKQGHQREPSDLITKLMNDRAAKRKTAPSGSFSKPGSTTNSPAHSRLNSPLHNALDLSSDSGHRERKGLRKLVL
jgi:hypothetical protein